jgi:hypothetical protein
MKKLTASQKNKLVKNGFTLVDNKLTFEQLKARIDGGRVILVFDDLSEIVVTDLSEIVDADSNDPRPSMFDRLLSVHRFDRLVACQLIENLNQASAGEENPDYVDEEILEHPLYPIFVAAIHQAIYGKGERHGGGKTPFMDQSWLHLANKHGNGFLTGQACKKIEEAAETRTGEPFDTEILGAINYAGMSIIHRRKSSM